MVGNILTFSSHFLNPPISEGVFPFKSNDWERFDIASRLLPARYLNEAWNKCRQVKPREQKLKPRASEDSSVIFPIHAPVRVRQGKPRPAALVVGHLPFRKKKINVLVVEDSVFQQIVVRKILEPLDCFVTIAESGEHGIDFCQKNSYDIIFMDLELPGMNGITATKVIRKTKNLNQNTFITALTSRDEPEIKQEAFTAGMNDYLLKPLDRTKAKKVLGLIRK